MATRPTFQAQHFNAIAKEIRELFGEYAAKANSYEERDRQESVLACGVLLKLSLNFAKRFADDNPNFNAIKFLDACSSDPIAYPFTEFWKVGR